MNYCTRFMASLVLVLVTGFLGACASSDLVKLPDGKFGHMKTVGDTLDRSTSFAGVYDCPVDKDGKPLYGKCTPVGPVDRVHGQTVAGQAVVGAVAGTGAAIINGNTARAVADRGQCKAGANCGTVINNQVQSVAEALNDNRVRVGVGVGAPACAATNTCGN